jgi:hypothetical protein
MSIEPWINWQFHKTPGLIDPRAAFTRASTARTVNRIGQLATKPANVSRFRFNPVSGVSEGLLCEPQRTNRLLRSEEFDNAAWTATNCTVTANSAVAPDGATTAETLAATASGGNVAQAVTITAGRGVAYSQYFKANTSSWAWMQIGDGTNTVQCWFNLASGVAGSNTAGAGTLLFSQKTIEAMGNGWYRCAIEATSSTVTAITATCGPAAAGSTAPANGDSVFVWGAQAEADATLTNPTSYIPTTSATVTRSADNLILPVSSSQVSLDRGTMLFEWTQRPIPATTGGQSITFGGIGNTFDNAIYVGRQGASVFGVTYIQNGVGGMTVGRTCLFVPGVTYRFGVSWMPGRIATCIDGGTIGTLSVGTVAPLASVARLAVGCAPWSSSSTTTVSNAVHRAFLYAPVAASDALLQQLTAP